MAVEHLAGGKGDLRTADADEHRRCQHPTAVPTHWTRWGGIEEVLLRAAVAPHEHIEEPGHRRAPHALTPPPAGRIGQARGEGGAEQLPYEGRIERPVAQRRRMQVG